MVMKKSSFILFIGLLCSQSITWSQSNDFSEIPAFRGGFSLGANLSQVDGDTYAGVHKIGLRVGPTIDVKIKNNFGFNFSILYSEKGSKNVSQANSNAGSYFLKYDIKANYVELPFSLTLVSERLIYGAGISYNLLVSTKEFYRGINGRVDYDNQQFTFNKNNLDAMLHVGYQLNSSWRAVAQYQQSITPIRDLKNVPQDFHDKKDQTNNLFAVKLEYLF